MPPRMSVVMVLVLASAVLPSARASPSTEGAAFHQDAREAREQATSYAQATRAQIQQLTSQIQTLKTQARSATDSATKQQLRAQLKAVREQMCEQMNDLAMHRVQWAEQGVVFAQRRVELARAQLAQLETREARMEHPERPR